MSMIPRDKRLFLAVVAIVACAVTSSVGSDASTAVFHPDLVEATRKLDKAHGPELYSALREVWDTWDRADPAQVEDVLVRAESDARIGPGPRGYAGLLAAYARLRRGDVAAATARIRALGYVDHWQIVGPFENDGKVGLDVEYGPEAEFATAIVPGRAYAGKDRPVRFRKVPDRFPWGYLDAGSLVRPERAGCVYATSYVSSKKAPKAGEDITLWVGTSGATKVFWNGELVLTDTAYRHYDADRLAVRVHLAPTMNNLTVKACGDEAGPVVSVRLADATGRPDASLEATNELEASARAADTVRELTAKKGKRATPTQPFEGPLQAFDRLTQGKNRRAEDLESYARYLDDTGGDDPAKHLARDLAQRAADLEPTLPRLLLAAELAEDRNQRARWIERAEKLAGKGRPNKELLIAKAALAKESLNPREAFPLYSDVLRIDPDDVTALQGHVEIYNDVGLRRTALALLEGAAARNPSSVLISNMYASELRALGRDTEASEMESRYAGLRSDDRTLLSRLIDLGVARRNRSAAERWVERLVAVEPDSQWAYGVAARAYRGLGEPERAVAAYQMALEIAPDDVSTLKALADLQGELGRRTEELALLGKVLEIEPQNKDVREYVEHLEPSGSRLDEAYSWDSDRFLKLRQAPTAGENRRTLLDLTVSTVFENGLSSKFRQIVFQPLSEAAAALARQYAFQYEADVERVQLRGARVFRSDGKVDEAIESGEGAADDPAIAMYTSARTFYVQFPRLEPGDVVELKYRIDSISAENQIAAYFGDVAYLQSSEPISHAEYVLLTPSSRKFYFDSVRVPGLKEVTEAKGAQRVYRFFADDVPQISPEPAMPPWPSLLGYLHVSTFEKWSDLGRWYWGLIHEQFDVDDDTRKLAKKIAEGKETPLDKVKAVYDWVVSSTRYVGLEFGIYGYKPHRCVQTVTRGWGDCKDKATVIVTLLKELGIDSTFVIVRSGMRGDFDSKVASLAPFDHAIVYVPSLKLYLDGTAEYTGSSELPAMDAGALAVRLNKGNPEIVRLPIPDPETNARRREVTAVVHKDGAAALDIAYETVGTTASAWRRRFHPESTRRDRLSEDLAGEFPGFAIAPGPTGITTSDLDDLEAPVSMKIRGAATRFGRKEGDNLSLPVTLSMRLTPIYASLSARKLDVNLPPLGTLNDTITVKLPPGFHVVSGPANAKGDTPFGAYSVTFEEQPGKVVVSSHLTVKVVKVTPDRYGAWKQFCEDADAALTPRLVIGPA